MKSFKTTARLSLMIFIICLSVSGLRAIKIGHLDYRILSEKDRTVDVAWGEPMQGSIVTDSLFIPESISIDGIKYEVREVRDSGFFGCSRIRTFIQTPPSLKVIKRLAFYNLKHVKCVDLSKGVESIEYAAFEYASIRQCIFPSKILKLKKIASCAFFRCDSLDNVVLPGGVAIYDCAFMGYQGKHVTFNEGPTKLDNISFLGTENLEYIEIPYGVSLYSGVFKGAYKLKTVMIHDGVKFYGEGAFDPYMGGTDYVDYALQSVIYLEPEPQSIGSIFNQATYDNATLYVLPEAMDKARTTYPWNQFAHIFPWDISVHDLKDNLTNLSATQNGIWDLQGNRYSHPSGALSPGIYLKRTNGKTEKLFIKQ